MEKENVEKNKTIITVCKDTDTKEYLVKNKHVNNIVKTPYIAIVGTLHHIWSHIGGNTNHAKTHIAVNIFSKIVLNLYNNTHVNIDIDEAINGFKKDIRKMLDNKSK